MRFDAETMAQGLKGESIVRDILAKKHIHYFQADLIVETNHGYEIWEVKHQEPFEPPPFYGHGLPKWQMDARLKFQRETGIRAVLVVVDSVSNTIYWQYMDKLIEGLSFQTQGNRPRIIFPLEAYNIYDEDVFNRADGSVLNDEM